MPAESSKSLTEEVMQQGKTDKNKVKSKSFSVPALTMEAQHTDFDVVSYLKQIVLKLMGQMQFFQYTTPPV